MNKTPLTISGPYTHENLTIFLFHANGQIDGSRYISLKKAFEKKKVRVYETGTVGQLEAENLSETIDIFIQAGDVLKGGWQDRTLGIDFIIPARRDQLASVEPGAVIADIAETASIAGNPLKNALVTLSKNYRFGNKNAIYQLSSAVRVGNSDEALKILNDRSFQELGSAAIPPPAQVAVRLEETVVERYKQYLGEKEPAKALAALQQFRVLCALREGPFGVKQINRLIEAALHKRGLIADPSRSYGGMPILITQNDYQTRLFNGDVGILLPDPTDRSGSGPGQLWAWFIGEDNNLRRLSPGRLPDQEIAYAMTVHKAQGSEFEQVLLVLPDRDSAVLTRELVYTGITRASKGIDLWFNEELLRMAIDRKAVRASGLRDALHAAR